MNCSSRVLFSLIACGFAVPALASAQVSVARPCPVENAQVTVSFSGMDTDVTAARTKLDAKMAEVKALAQEQQFTKLVIQSHSYSINTGYNGGNGGESRFQYSGNITFQLLPAEKAVDFMQLLAKKGYQTSVNVNSYNNYNATACGQNLER
jgi:uncharacterized protein YggE